MTRNHVRRSVFAMLLLWVACCSSAFAQGFPCKLQTPSPAFPLYPDNKILCATYLVGDPYWTVEPSWNPLTPPGRFGTREDAMNWLLNVYGMPSSEYCPPKLEVGPVVTYSWNIQFSVETWSFSGTNPVDFSCSYGLDGSHAKLIRKPDFRCPSGYQSRGPGSYGFSNVDNTLNP